MTLLNVSDHSRDFAGMTYVYPVLSRRAGGVSVGINLNPNNACNWHCVYCQVPNLVRGAAPLIDRAQLHQELSGFLSALVDGDYMQQHVPEGLRTIKDIAFSGNGEPTSAGDFADIVNDVLAIRDAAGLTAVPVRLITNGSLVKRRAVQDGLRRLAAGGGEVWFKVDGGRREDIARINGVDLDPASVSRALAKSAELCPTWVQTCMFAWDGEVPSEAALAGYLNTLEVAGLDALEGVLLYGVVRASMQPEAVRVSALDEAGLMLIAERIKEKGLTVRVSP
ncbi:radical SAM protein [Denitromonas halophila]|uniref:Radical SAM protein n=1 Tax=Denitromonas halophila TaxID=1629404 RepID=A0A557QJY7_9RHOO|nr:radical SAM protein [Denitromonas halophila]TVO53216.1 radical SAM protein [Denitromonas halophila]